uniref:Uncharacterized protein n=1 Tax=Aegilops tauschii subsp. strangulata TaxID=200361 RepID=A0A453RLJ0_AEGTS
HIRADQQSSHVYLTSDQFRVCNFAYLKNYGEGHQGLH